MRRLSVLLLFIPLLLLAGLYFFFSHTNGGICLKSPVCTQDVKTLCYQRGESITIWNLPYYIIGFFEPSKETIKVWQGPSLCSCGLDTATLRSRGWVECEVPEGYKGQIQTRATLIKLPSLQIPKTLPLLIVPILSLSIGIGAIAVLWTKRE